MILEKLVYNTLSRETTIDYICTVCGDDGGRAVIPSMANIQVGADHHLIVSRWGRRSCRNNLLNRCYNNFCLYADNANNRITIESFSFFGEPPSRDVEMQVRCKLCGSINLHDLPGLSDTETVSIDFSKLGMRCCNNENCRAQYSLK